MQNNNNWNFEMLFICIFKKGACLVSGSDYKTNTKIGLPDEHLLSVYN